MNEADTACGSSWTTRAPTVVAQLVPRLRADPGTVYRQDVTPVS
ncbi:hypothetical protein ACGIF2_16740 [Cellulomonas sp. P22]